MQGALLRSFYQTSTTEWSAGPAASQRQTETEQTGEEGRLSLEPDDQRMMEDQSLVLYGAGTTVWDK